MKEHLFAAVALRAFLVIFLAEMADKTQLATIALSAHSKKPFSVFLGAVTALALVTLVGVICGEALARIIPARRIHQVAGFIFVVVGILMFFRPE